jgi:hypothetical protein
MKRRDFFALLGSAASAIIPCAAGAGPTMTHGPLSNRLVGSWHFVSAINMREDGSTYDRWGPEAKGAFMLDGQGNYSQIIMGPESRLFGAKSYFAFGTYTVEDASNTIISKIEGSSIVKLNGTVQQRIVTVLTANEMQYLNPVTASGDRVTATWKRMNLS